MKKFYIVLAVVATLAATLYAATPRLDFIGKDDSFRSILESDIARLVYFREDGAHSGEGATHVRVEASNGESTVFSLSDLKRIDYAYPTGLEPFAIDVETDGHCTVTMLDCVNNEGIIDPTKPHDWHGAESDYTGHFIYAPEYGYEMEVQIVGQYTGHVYSDTPGFIFFVPAEYYAQWTDSWGFYMPNEPITIKGISTELTTYVGQDFLGQYNGYQIAASPRVYAPTETTLNIDIRSNGSYVVKSTDDNAYDFHFMYSYDEDADMARHIAIEQPKWDNTTIFYGSDEKFIGDDFAYMTVMNYTTGRPEDTRHYLVAKNSFSFISGASEYADKYLVEAKGSDGVTKNLCILNNGSSLKLADFNFLSGQHINEACEVIVSYDGDTRLKYINDGTNEPLFIDKGAEAGTYSSATDAAADKLVLDGFGGATLGSFSDSYKYERGTVTLENSGRTFILDTANKTYTEQYQNDEWTGPMEFYIENATGAYGNSVSDRCKASIILNKDLQGNDKEGYAALTIDLWNSSWYEYRNMISSCPKFVYDEANATITLLSVLVGTGSGYNTEYRNLVLKVSDDLNSIWFDETINGAKIYGITSPTDWFATGQQNTLTAPEPPAPSLASKYEATFPKMIYFGGDAPFETLGTISIDADRSGNSKPGYLYFNITGGGMKMYDDVVEYEVSDNKLIMKNLEIGDANMVITAGNLEFEITSDGNLQGSATIYGNTASTIAAGVNLSLAPFTPVDQ